MRLLDLFPVLGPNTIVTHVNDVTISTVSLCDNDTTVVVIVEQSRKLPFFTVKKKTNTVFNDEVLTGGKFIEKMLDERLLFLNEILVALKTALFMVSIGPRALYSTITYNGTKYTLSMDMDGVTVLETNNDESGYKIMGRASNDMRKAIVATITATN